jgi:hypothetical protein
VCVCAPVDDVCLHRSRSWLVASVDWRSVFIFILNNWWLVWVSTHAKEFMRSGAGLIMH